MKKIKRDELYRHLNLFLKNRGVELKDGSQLSQRLEEGCLVLSDTINKTQTAIGRAKKEIGRAKQEVDGKIDKVREIIHTKTAPPKKRNTPKEQMKKTKKKAAKKAPAKKKVVKKVAPKKA
ncbi:hypothetical protein OAL86_01720, partial [Verrucomicrobia bacterium]|nr:hypothetical protein [Verrucomicrobiota bacterium]